MAQVAGLIGDVVGSRQVPDRPGLQERLLEVLGAVSERVGSPLAITLGDEFQGRYPSLSHALAASWYLHLGTIGLARLRIGVGWGEILVEPASPSAFGSDGPAWWRARDAIDRVHLSLPTRTLVVTETGWDELLNAYLMLRDAHFEDLDEADVAILEALEAGETQRAVAERLGLHESSVSRRVSRHGLAALLHIERHGRAQTRFLTRETNSGAQLRGPFVGEECPPDTRQREIDRRKIDGDFVGETARVVAVFTRDDCDRIAAVWPECAPPHDREGYDRDRSRRSQW